MTTLISRDVEYTHDGTTLLGMLVAPEGANHSPTVVLVHDAFGLGDEMVAHARALAELGYVVFAADVWGNRLTPGEQSEIGPLMGSMVGDRARWLARVAAAHETASAQPEVDRDSLVFLGYCFGGASALEYLRTGARIRGVISIHGGFDLLEHDWSAAAGGASVLLCTGADDPMATPEQTAALQAALSAGGFDWETDLYSDTVHAFTSLRAMNSPAPHVFAYNQRSASRAWASTCRFLGEVLPQR